MEIVRRGETCANRCRSASTRIIRPAVIDIFDASLFAHATVGVFSQNITTWHWFIWGMIAYKMSHPKSIPFSSRYEFIMYPCLFFLIPIGCRPPLGKLLPKKIRENWCVPLVYTHPAPKSGASVNPTYWGSPGTSSCTLLGCCDILLSNISKSSKVSATYGVGLMCMYLGLCCSAILRGWNKPLLAGTPIALCRRWPTFFWNFRYDSDVSFYAV